MTESEPLVLTLLSGALRLWRAVWVALARLAWAPVAALLAVPAALFLAPARFSGSRWGYVCFAPLRALALAAPLAPVAALWLLARLAHRLSAAEGVYVQTVVSATVLATIVGLWVRGHRESGARSGSVLAPYAAAAPEALRDAQAALVTLFVAGLLLRVPALLKLAADGARDYRDAVLEEVPRAVFEWVVLPFLLLALLLPWRLKELRTALYTTLPTTAGPRLYYERRSEIVKTGAAVLLDALAFAVVAPPLLLTAYRVPSLRRRLHNRGAACSWDDTRHDALEEGLQLLIDAPFVLCGLVLVLAGWWRVPGLLRELQDPAKTARDRRRKAATELGLWCFDFVAILCALVVLLTVYRAVYTYREWKRTAAPVEDPFRRHKVWSRAAYATLFVELPSFACAVPVVLTLWRLPVLVNRLRAVDSPAAAAAACARQGAEWLADLPFVIIFALLVAGVWRLPWLLPRMYRGARAEGAAGVREALAQTLRAWLEDVPALAAALLLLATVYRAPGALRRLRAGTADPKDWLFRHRVLLAAAKEVLFDVPFLLMAAVGTAVPWRAPGLWRRAFFTPGADQHSRREAAVRACVAGLLDTPCALMVVVLVASAWRAPLWWRDMRRPGDTRAPVPREHADYDVAVRAALDEPWRRTTMGHFFKLLRPQELLAAACAWGSLWRLPGLLRGLTGEESDRRRCFLAYVAFITAAADVVAGGLAVVVTATLWRAFELWGRLLGRVTDDDDDDDDQEHEDQEQDDFRSTLLGALRTHLVVLRQTVLLIRDTPYILALLANVVAPWRWRALARRLRGAGSFKEKLRASSESAARGASDIPCIVVAVLLLPTWRGSIVWPRLRDAAKAALSGSDGAEGFHELVLYQAYQLALDAPFVAASPLLLWRLPGVVAKARPGELESDAVALVECSVRAEFPAEQTRTGSGAMDGHGLRLVVSGVRQRSLQFARATLAFGPDAFWAQLGQVAPASVISVFRATMHPLGVAPGAMFDPAPLCGPAAGGAPVAASVELGTGVGGGAKICHETMRGALRGLANKGNPALELRLDYQLPAGRRYGCLCRAATTPDALLRALTAYQPFDLDVITAPVVGLAPASAYELRLAVLRGAGLAVLDVLCAAAVALVALVPWRWPAIKALEPAHKPVATLLLRTLAGLPFDLLALAFCLACPWRLRRLAGWLCFVEQSAGDVARRRNKFLAVAGICTAEWVVISLALLVAATLWRLPSLLHGLRAALRSGRMPPTGKAIFNDFLAPVLRVDLRRSYKKSGIPPKFLVASVVLDQFWWLLLDLLQLSELLFVVATLVQVPSAVRRVWAYSAEVSKQALLQARRAKAKARAAAPVVEGAAEGGRCHLTRTLPRQLPYLVLPYLEAPELCAASQTHAAWAEAGALNTFWRPLVARRWHMGVVHESVTVDYRAEFRRRHVAELEQRRRRPLSQAESDAVQGLRFVLHEEARQAWHRLPHFFLLPVKLYALLLLPLMHYIRLRNVRPRWMPAWLDTLLQHGRLMGFPASALQWTFWNLHECAFMWTLAVFAYIVCEASSGLAVINLLLLSAMTLGGPIWMNLPGVGVARDTIAGLVFPAYWVVQLWFVFVADESLAMTVVGAGQWLMGPLAWLLGWALWFVPTSWLAWLWSFVPGVPAAATAALGEAAAALGDGRFGAVLGAVYAWGAQWPQLLLSGGSVGTISLVPLVPALQLEVGVLRSALLALVTPFELLLRAEAAALGYAYALQIPAVTFVADWVGWLLTSRLVRWALSAAVWLWAQLRTGDVVSKLVPGVRPMYPYLLPFRFARYVARLLLRLVRWVRRQVERVVRFLWRCYSQSLRVLTRICRKLGLLGDLLLVPIAIGWVGWPMLVPRFFASTLLYLPAVLFTLSQLGWAHRIISKEWSG